MVLAAIDPDGEMSRALRAAGLRVTMPRLAMLTWLAGHPHATVDAIAAGVRERFGTVSTQAVYDMLAACATAGLLRRIEPAGPSRPLRAPGRRQPSPPGVPPLRPHRGRRLRRSEPSPA